MSRLSFISLEAKYTEQEKDEIDFLEGQHVWLLLTGRNTPRLSHTVQLVTEHLCK